MGRADAVSCSQVSLVVSVPIEGDFFPGRVSHSCSHAAGTCTMERLSASTHCHMQLCVCAQTDLHMYVRTYMYNTCTYNTCIRMYVLMYVYSHLSIVICIPTSICLPTQTGRAVQIAESAT